MSATDLIDDLRSGRAADLFIDGEWRPARSGRRFEVQDPAHGTALTQAADADADDALAALAAADRAQHDWATVAPRQRSDLLMAAYQEVLSHRDHLATLITLEMGKSVAEAAAEVTYGAEFLRWFAEEAVRIDGRLGSVPSGRLQMQVHRRPVGPCLLITPWNFPLAMATRKIGPALAAGCTAVVKPAELTPLTTIALAAIFEDVGLPPGVLNVVTTANPDAAFAPVIADSRLRKLSFTGSTAVGKRLLARAGDGVVRCSMELGGNAPFIVLADADVDAAVEGAVIAKTRNVGQACTAANRFLVQEAVAEAFTSRFCAAMDQLTTGVGTDPATDLGPLIDERSRERVHGLVEDAVERGAHLLVGGAVPTGPGTFYPATVLSHLQPGSQLLSEEIFGPVAAVQTFSDEMEAVRIANDTPYGLVAYVYTRDLARAQRVVQRLEVGMVGVNTGVVSDPATPFGGVKHSGLGREGGREGIDEYLEVQYVGIAP